MKIKTFEAFSMNKDICDRCGGDTNGHTIMSMYNEDVICMRCKDKEKQRDDYSVATDADNKEIKKGNYNFKGIGYNEVDEGVFSGVRRALSYDTKYHSKQDAWNKITDYLMKKYKMISIGSEPGTIKISNHGVSELKINIDNVNYTTRNLTVNGKVIEMDNLISYIDKLVKNYYGSYLKESADDSIQKWDIFAGLGGGFGGANYMRTETCTKNDAETCAYEDACDEYESYAGMHGIRSHSDIMDEDGVDEEEADEIYNEERESWLDYYVKPHDPKNKY